jgi:putative FmdB family regulatory protein
MPIYEYKCTNGHVFEVMQRMSDDPVTKCEICGAPVQRVFHPIAVHFKGSGFYNTDYGTKRRAREMKESAGEGGSNGSDSKSSDSKSSDSKSSDTKSSETKKSDTSSTSSSSSSKSD